MLEGGNQENFSLDEIHKVKYFILIGVMKLWSLR